MDALGLEVMSCSSSSRREREFDEIIGHIEDIIIGEKFEGLQKCFLNKHYHHFEDKEENKLEYTLIFKKYQDEIEKYIENELQQRIPDFSMNNFVKRLTSKESDLEGDVFEVLLTFSDFLEFKNLMLDFKKDKEGRNVHLSTGLVVTSLSKMNI